jgi:hypothetical protein
VATFFVVPKSAAPRNSDWGGKSFSDTFFLNVLKPHIVEAVTFDDKSVEAEDMFWGECPGDKRPLLCRRWAESNGVKASDYFFIVPNDRNSGEEEEERAGDEWPENAEQIMLSWEYIESYCVSQALLNSRIARCKSDIQKWEGKLQELVC